MTDDLKLPQIGELTLPRWQYWLARYNEVLGERERRIEKLEAALQWILSCEMVSFRSADFHGSNCNCRRCAMDNAQHLLEGKDDVG